MNFEKASYKKRLLELHSIKSQEKNFKLNHIYDAMTKNNLDAYLMCDSSAIGWILDLRDLNAKYNLLIVGYLLITKTQLRLYLDPLYDITHDDFFRPMDELKKDLSKLRCFGYDKLQAPTFIDCNNSIDIKNPCRISQLIKSTEEINNIKSVAVKDSVAFINFLHWFYHCDRKISEFDVLEKITFFKKAHSEFVCESFNTIAAADHHASIVHYAVDMGTNKNVENILLLDCGGQYKYGTTDVTRTFCWDSPKNEEKRFYTLVLKGHIAVAKARFSRETSCNQLDAMARQFLHQHGADYNHGTGHGVGYFANVHHGDVSISKKCSDTLEANMLFTNEPGYYIDEVFGVRLENMMITKQSKNDMLSFETISLVPFDWQFIDKTFLSAEEIDWINEYHHHIIETLQNHLSQDVLNWLETYTKNT